MALFAGLDVSLKMTSICIVESDGSLVWEGKAESEPTALLKALSKWRKKIKLIGIEACPLSEWLYGALVESGLPTVCIETRHAQRFLSSRPNKTDRSDARGIADMMRLGHYRPVHVKSKESQLLRTTPIARKKFVDHMLAIEDTIRGLLKVHGLKLGAVHRCTFAARVETLLADAPELRTAIEPLLEARNMMRKQKALLDRRLGQTARKDEVCKRLGEIDRSGNISKCGDKLMRHALYEAANSHLRISKKWPTLRAWGVKLAQRIGMKKACVAVARKLAIIMHRMWIDGTDFRFGRPPVAAAA